MDVETAARIFEGVDPGILDTIIGNANDPDAAYIAQVLDTAAEKGKLPDKNYTAMAADKLVDDEEVEDVPGLTKEHVLRGLQASQAAEGNNWEQKANAAIQSGDVARMVKTMNASNGVGTDSLLNPASTSFPGNVKKATIMLANEVADQIEAAAERGDAAELQEMRDTIAAIESDSLRDRLLEKVTNLRTLVENEGTEFEEAREAMLDASPAEVQDVLDRIDRGAWDVTYQQRLEIAKEAKARLEAMEQEIENEDGGAGE